MQALTDSSQVADLAAKVERMERELQSLRQSIQVKPTGKPYRIQSPNPIRELDQPSVTLANLTKVVAALVEDLTEARVVRKA